MKTSSAKAKGRRLQQQVARMIQSQFNLPKSDVKSLPMGSQGCDVWLSSEALKAFPFSIECKNVEKLNIWTAFDQATANRTEAHPPLLLHSKNRRGILATLAFEDLLQLLSRVK